MAPETDRRDDAAQLSRQLDEARERERELRALLARAHEQLAQRDEELVRSALSHKRVEDMRATRVWRMAERWWATRDRLLRRSG